MTLRIVTFILINFAALGLGGILMGQGPGSEWYQNLNKAPWTPPGWTFGAAWFTIMTCFGFYMAKLWEMERQRSFILVLFILQWLLNVSWNPTFFMHHQALIGLFIISVLTLLIGFFLIHFHTKMKTWTLFILPYFIWLIIATSLNAFVYLRN